MESKINFAKRFRSDNSGMLSPGLFPSLGVWKNVMNEIVQMVISEVKKYVKDLIPLASALELFEKIP